jgi:hypothetical protein
MFISAQLNGKQKETRHTAVTESALPPQRYGGRSLIQAFALALTPLETASFWEGRKGRSASPDTGQQAVSCASGSP